MSNKAMSASAVPTTELAKRIATIMHRRLSTPWSEREIRQYKKLVKSGCFKTLDDLELVERYYIAERRKGDRGIHRRDLYTLIFNWQGEVDRATAWNEAHPVKPPPRKIIQMPPTPSEPYISTLEDEARTEKFMADYRARKRKA